MSKKVYQPTKVNTVKVTKPVSNIPENKILIGIPAQDMMHTDFVRCLMSLDRPTNSTVLFIKGTILPNSRDTLASTALSNNFTHILFVDSDMTFPNNALTKLLAHNADIVTGVAVARREPHTPCIYSAINYTDADFKNGLPHVVSCKASDIEGKDYFEVKGCGMAFCLIKTTVIKHMLSTYGELFKYIKTYGEDLSFCIRATSLGYKIMVDNTITIGHLGQEEFTPIKHMPRE